MTPETQKKYEEKLKRLQDALALREPDRVPIDISGGQYMIQRLGYTLAECNYDESLDIIKEAATKFMLDFDPDTATGLGLTYAGEGPGHEMQGSKTMFIAGMKGDPIGKDSMPQFVEFPTLMDDEFDEFLGDYTKWSINKFLPRVSTVLEPFRDLHLPLNHRGISDIATNFGKPEIRKAIQTLWEIDDFYKAYRKKTAAATKELNELGFPSLGGGRATVPFDKYSDTFRGMEEGFCDLFENEEVVLKYCERYHKEQLEELLGSNPDGKRNGKLVSMSLHKGSDDMMGNEFYEKYYWPHLKEIIEACHSIGMICSAFCEGVYTDKLEYLADVPKCSAYYTFDKVDLKRAKETCGKVCCIGGGFPSPLLVYEKPEVIKDEVKKLLDIAMPGGGYIFRCSAGINGAKEENVEAMFETVREYGRYR